MSKMVEVAARALHAQIVKDFEGNGAWTDADADGYEDVINIDGHIDLRKFVRTVIEAMREPSTAMLVAAMRCRANTGQPGLRPKNEYEAMIDAALGEKP